MTVTAEATGKVIEYSVPDFQDVPDERCWMCAGVTNGQGLLVADRITEMFSDVHLMRWKESKSLCMACAGLQKQRPFRLYSMLATEDGVRHLARASWAEILTNPPEPPWAACLAVSGQKHLFYKTQVNYQNKIVYVQMEDLGIRFDPGELAVLLGAVENLYRIFTKDEISTGYYSSRRVLQYGMREFEQDEWHVKHYRGERLLNLAVWIARRDEDAREAKLQEAKIAEQVRKQKKADVQSQPPVQPVVEPAQKGQMSLF